MRRRSDAAGVYLLVILVALACGITATFGVGRVFRSMNNAAIGSAARPPYVPAPDPITRAEAGLLPESTEADRGQPSRNIRTIQVFPSVLYLTAGGEIVRQIPLAKSAQSLVEVVNAVNDSRWISNAGGLVRMHAALIFEPKTDVVISTPVYKVVMDVKPGVYLGATGAHLRINNVTVQAADDKVPHDGQVGDGSRPFVVASDSSRMDVANSRFLYLGRDWNASYGVSWVRGSTGSAFETMFERNFIGAFTARAHDISFLKNTFRNNVLYGIAPRTSTTGLTIEQNLAEGNGHHGIVLSDHVNGSVIRYNNVRNNKVNGIMMDFASDQNLIEGNRVTGNMGDGIVMSDSAQNHVVGNMIENNRVGAHVYGKILRPNDFARNTVKHNVVAAQGADLSVGNTLQGNGTRWEPIRVATVWVLTAVMGALLCLLTWRSRRQRIRHVVRYNRQAERMRAGAA